MSTIPETWVGKPVGQILRETREARGFSLEDAARVTRISKNYLASIEAEAYEKLPSPAYIKGFLRIYAGYLDLSGDAVVACYERGTAPVPPVVEKPAARPAPKGDKAFTRKSGRWSIPLLLLVLVLIASFFYGERDERPQRPQPPTPPPPPAALPPSPVLPPRTSAIPPPPEEAPAAPAQETTIEAPVPQGKGLVLRLKVNQDSLLSISIDSGTSQKYDLKSGDVIEWKGEKAFTLELSNGGGVAAELNGKPVAPLGAVGKPAHVVLKAEGTQAPE
ncbi:helix-turn-helix domain-containing protein [Geobacter sp. DSM 9736]|uniref:helix-turn-helix domain-containing protein n=1 Tax=Geobacter sp. DSM 9736 TaxID=1277350 RepID=UPI000B50E747|nr:helix-turn-helix domain-containing protein [Geobacter sp. DSM 9736]SNB44886.1 protein of unknown function [Geobacter sp. DSM 9736]